MVRGFCSLLRRRSGLPPLGYLGFAACLLLSLALTGPAGVPWDLNPQKSYFYPPFPPDRITQVRGRLLGDSRPLTGDRTLLTLDQVFCLDREGNRGSAAGTLGVILPGEAALYRGTPVEFEGRLSAGEEGGGLFLARLPDPGWEEGGAPEEAGLRLRRRILRWERAKLDSLGEAGGLIQALLFGLRDDLDGALLFQFRRAGVMHILALSGMHLGFLAAFLSFLLRPLGQRVVRPGILLFFVFYLFLTGFSVSLFRAAVMSGLYYLAQVRTGRAEALKVWGTSFILCFLVNPSGLSGPGFQLTFAALGGILILGLPLSRDLRGVLPGFAASPVGVSLGAQGASLPFLIYHFGAFAPAGLVCGLLLSPLIGVFMALGLVFLLLPDPGALAFRLGVRLPGVAAFLYDGFQNLLRGVYRLIQETAAFFSGFPEVAVSPDRRGGVIAIFALIWLIIILGEAYDAERGRTQLRLAAAAARTSCPPGPGDE